MVKTSLPPFGLINNIIFFVLYLFLIPTSETTVMFEKKTKHNFRDNGFKLQKLNTL